MLESKTSPRGQTAAQEMVRKTPDRETGDSARPTSDGGVVRIQPVRPTATLRGIVQHTGPALSLKDMDRAIAKGACES